MGVRGLIGLPSARVTQHSFRTAILGYILASLEGANPPKTATLCLFHDTQEARVNDLHKVAQRFIDLDTSESYRYFVDEGQKVAYGSLLI